MPDGKTLGFAYANLDRAAIQRTDPTWLAKRLDDPASRFVCFIGERPAIDVSAPNVRVVQYTGKEVRDAGCQSEPVLLGIDDAGKALFAVQSELGSNESAVPGDHKLIDLRSLASQGVLATGELGMLAQARSLLHWHERHRFCANCGAATEQAEAGYRRHCNACSADHFPRTDPVVIMVVIGRANACSAVALSLLKASIRRLPASWNRAKRWKMQHGARFLKKPASGSVGSITSCPSHGRFHRH